MKFDSENAEHQAKLEEIRGRFPEKWLSGPEMLQILKTCGVTVRQFADHLGRSDNYVRQCLGYRLPNPTKMTAVSHERDRMHVVSERWLNKNRKLGLTDHCRSFS